MRHPGLLFASCVCFVAVCLISGAPYLQYTAAVVIVVGARPLWRNMRHALRQETINDVCQHVMMNDLTEARQDTPGYAHAIQDHR